jgi:hypothetical protein
MRGRRWAVVLGTLALVLILGAGVFTRRSQDGGARRTEATAAVEAKAGDFADYWAEVLKLSRRYGASPDSFRAGLDALRGSHLTDAEWAAWVAPYRDAPDKLAAKMESTLAATAPTPSRPPRQPAPRGEPPATSRAGPADSARKVSAVP